MDKVTKQRENLRKQMRRQLEITVDSDIIHSLDGQTVEDAVDFLKTKLLMVDEKFRKLVKLRVDYTSNYYNDRETKLSLYYCTPEPLADVDKRIDQYLEEAKLNKEKRKEQEIKDYQRLHKKYGRNNKTPAL